MSLRAYVVWPIAQEYVQGQDDTPKPFLEANLRDLQKQTHLLITHEDDFSILWHKC